MKNKNNYISGELGINVFITGIVAPVEIIPIDLLKKGAKEYAIKLQQRTIAEKATVAAGPGAGTRAGN